mmetsp:Transcript_33610/g.30538  ORF Transcript_33610/g.30538 Transcript_33610/m.30538 type:complete len:94 (-) Transcript_33610:124-405(-)
MLRENPKLYAETQEKAHDVLRKMVPSHIFQSIISPENIATKIRESSIQREIENARYRFRALERKDLVKFRQRRLKFQTLKGAVRTKHSEFPNF